MSVPIDASDEVLSGEAVALDVQPIGFILRAVGAVIDMLIVFAALIAWIFLRLWLLNLGILVDSTDQIATVVALVFCFLVLPVTVEVVTRGRSVGKLVVGGRIVRLDGGAISFRHAFIRGLLGVLEIYMTFGGLAVLVGAFTSRSQRLGDLVAGTYSQRVRTPRLVPLVPVMPAELLGWAQIADVARMPDRLSRRISQFLQTAPQMLPSARSRVAQTLLADAAPFVSPIPPSALAAPEAVLVGITVLRRERERRAIEFANARTEKLTGRRTGV